MATLDFDSVETVRIVGDRFLVVMRKGDLLYEMTLDRLTVALLLHQLVQAIPNLPGNLPPQQTVIPMAVQPFVARGGEPGVEFLFSEKLTLPLQLGNAGLVGLRNAIERLAPGDDSSPPTLRH